MSARPRIVRRLAVRAGVAVAVWAAHRAVASWLLGTDPIAELLAGDRLAVGGAIAALVPLRICAWFVVGPWVAAGTVADLLARRRYSASAQPSQVPRSWIAT